MKKCKQTTTRPLPSPNNNNNKNNNNNNKNPDIFDVKLIDSQSKPNHSLETALTQALPAKILALTEKYAYLIGNNHTFYKKESF
jgi:hypothetical protein